MPGAITFAVVGDVIVSAVDDKPKSTGELARLRRIQRQPRVCLLADLYDEDWSRLWWVRADALAQVRTSGAQWRAALGQLQDKYEHYRQDPPRGAVIAAAVHRWTGWAATDRHTT